MVSTIIIPMIILTAFCVGARGQSHQKTRTLIKTLGLHTPALFPTGHPLRDSGYADPAIDLRHGPNLPRHGLFMAGLLFGRPEPGHKNTSHAYR